MSFARFAFTTVTLAFLPFAAFAQAAAPAADATAAAPATPPITMTPPIIATPAPIADNAPVTHGEIPALVKKALLDNPDMLMDAIQKLRQKETEASQKEAKGALEKHKTELFNDPESPGTGPKTADVTLVEFFDYHCGYCKRLLPSISRLLDEDKNVRVVFKEFPILADDSVTAARAALAVNRIAPDKYFAYHTALMNSKGKFEEKMLMEEAKKLGIDTKKLKTEMEKPEITAILDKNRTIAMELGIHGTPGLVTVSEVVPGAVPYEEIKRMVDDTRSGKSSAPTPPPAPADQPKLPAN